MSAPQPQQRYSMPPNPLPYNNDNPYQAPPSNQGQTDHHHRLSYPENHNYPEHLRFPNYQQRPQQTHAGQEPNNHLHAGARQHTNLGATSYLISHITPSPLMSQFFAESPTSPGISRDATTFALRAYLETFLFYIGYDPSNGTTPQSFIYRYDDKLGKELGMSPEKARKLYIEIFDATTPTLEAVCKGIVGMEEKLGCGEEAVKAVRFLFKRNHGLTPEEMLGGSGKVVGVDGESILDEKVQAGLIRDRKAVKAETGGSGWKKFWRFGKNTGKKETEENIGEIEIGEIPIHHGPTLSTREERAPNGRYSMGQHQDYHSSNRRQSRHPDQHPIEAQRHRSRHLEPQTHNGPSLEHDPENNPSGATARRSRSVRQQERAPPLRDNRDLHSENVNPHSANRNTMSGALLSPVEPHEVPMVKQQSLQNDSNASKESYKAQKTHHYRRRSASDLDAGGENTGNQVNKSQSQRNKKHRNRGSENDRGITMDGGDVNGFGVNNRNADVLNIPGEPTTRARENGGSRTGEEDSHVVLQDPFVDSGTQETSGTGERVRRRKDKSRDDNLEKEERKKKQRSRKSQRERETDTERDGNETERPRTAHGDGYELDPPANFGGGAPESGTMDSTQVRRKKLKMKSREKENQKHAYGEDEKEKERKRRRRKGRDRDRGRERSGPEERQGVMAV